MPAVADALTREVGVPGVVSWQGFLDNWEDTADLRWPLNVVVYDRMRRSDSQVDAVLSAMTLPIRRAAAKLSDPENEVDPRVMDACQVELGLDATGRNAKRRRRRGGVVFSDLIRHGLLALPFGFMPLERTWEVGPPERGQDGPRMPRRMAHLRLSPRMPRTITGIDLAPNGDLAGLRQYVPNQTSGLLEEKTLERERLMMFVHDREGADWSGRSVLRSSYRHWFIKDALLKLGPMAVERNGMGVPVVHYPADGSRDEALAIAKAFRAGDEAGAALPEGWTLDLVGVTGTVRDELPLVKYHDESVGRAALAMFLNLGHDKGARSLGDTFVDYFVMATEAIVEDLEDTVTDEAIREFVSLNFGEDEPYPELEFDALSQEARPTEDGLKALADAGLIRADDDLEDDIRRRFGLPAAMTKRPPATTVDVGAGVVAVGDLPATGQPPMPMLPGHQPPPLQAVPAGATAASLAARALDVASRLAAVAEAEAQAAS